LKIGILGGTGKEARGLALRWARAGSEVLIGSRDGEKGARIAGKINEALGGDLVQGLENAAAAARADVVVSTLPYQGQRETLSNLKEHLQGKLVLVAALIWPPGTIERPAAAEEAQATLGDGSRVVAAFQTVSAVGLRNLDEDLEEHVLVCADDDEARRDAIQVIGRAGLVGIDAGPLRHTRIIEAMTGILIHINKRYGVKSSGLRITGIDSSTSPRN
jgi:NADPH-dependent F420 reductase